jgi:hypothetical protein
MKSAAKGKGHDSYIRAAKQQVSQARADVWKAALIRRQKEREKDGTVDTALQHHQKRLDPGMPGGSVSAQLDRVRIKTR